MKNSFVKSSKYKVTCHCSDKLLFLLSGVIPMNLISLVFHFPDNLCCLVVRLPGCRPRGPGFDSGRCKIFLVATGLERVPISLLRINEELLERKVAAPV
jgi:hypothetical protein